MRTQPLLPGGQVVDLEREVRGEAAREAGARRGIPARPVVSASASRWISVSPSANQAPAKAKFDGRDSSSRPSASP